NLSPSGTVNPTDSASSAKSIGPNSYSSPSSTILITESGDDVINMVEEGEELEFGPIDFADDAESVGFTVPEGDKLSVDLTAGESGDVEVTAGEIKNTVYA